MSSMGILFTLPWREFQDTEVCHNSSTVYTRVTTVSAVHICLSLSPRQEIKIKTTHQRVIHRISLTLLQTLQPNIVLLFYTDWLFLSTTVLYMYT